MKELSWRKIETIDHCSTISLSGNKNNDNNDNKEAKQYKCDTQK